MFGSDARMHNNTRTQDRWGFVLRFAVTFHYEYELEIPQHIRSSRSDTLTRVKEYAGFCDVGGRSQMLGNYPANQTSHNGNFSLDLANLVKPWKIVNSGSFPRIDSVATPHAVPYFLLFFSAPCFLEFVCFNALE